MSKFPAANKYNTLDFNQLIQDIEFRIKHPTLQPEIVWHDSQTILDDLTGALKSVKVIPIEAEIATKNFFVDEVCVETPLGPRIADVHKVLPVYEPSGDEEADKVADANLGQGVILINNLFRANDWVKGYLRYFITERRYDRSVLGSGWAVVCLHNYYDDASELPSRLDLLKFGHSDYQETPTEQ